MSGSWPSSISVYSVLVSTSALIIVVPPFCVPNFKACFTCQDRKPDLVVLNPFLFNALALKGRISTKFLFVYNLFSDLGETNLKLTCYRGLDLFNVDFYLQSPYLKFFYVATKLYHFLPLKVFQKYNQLRRYIVLISNYLNAV